MTRKPKMYTTHTQWLHSKYHLYEQNNVDPLEKFEEISFAFGWHFNISRKRAKTLVKRYNDHFRL